LIWVNCSDGIADNKYNADTVAAGYRPEGDGMSSVLKATRTGEPGVAMRIQSAIPAILLAALVFLPQSAAAQLSPRAQRGLTYAQANCSRCHAVDKVSQSPLPIAPPFRTLHLRYPVENLQEALAEGIRTGHPNMPAFRLDPGQITDLITYLKTLER
jgi:mono/diheme cytochrome c family protein